MLSLKKCLQDIAGFFSISNNSLKVGSILIQWDTLTQNIAASDRTNFVVSFPKKYSTTPRVFTESVANTNYPELFHCGAKLITETEFTMIFRNQTSNAVTLRGNWLAIGRA